MKTFFDIIHRQHKNNLLSVQSRMYWYDINAGKNMLNSFFIDGSTWCYVRKRTRTSLIIGALPIQNTYV